MVFRLVLDRVCNKVRESLCKFLNFEHFDKDFSKSSKIEWHMEFLLAHLAIINSTSSSSFSTLERLTFSSHKLELLDCWLKSSKLLSLSLELSIKLLCCIVLSFSFFTVLSFCMDMFKFSGLLYSISSSLLDENNEATASAALLRRWCLVAFEFDLFKQ